jgi:hypothetical protein
MRASTIQHLVERIQHANEHHGRFINGYHVIDAASIELKEAKLAADYGSSYDTIDELLDVAVVCIRGAEQLGGYDPADVALTPSNDSGPSLMSMPGEHGLRIAYGCYAKDNDNPMSKEAFYLEYLKPWFRNSEG